MSILNAILNDLEAFSREEIDAVNPGNSKRDNNVDGSHPKPMTKTVPHFKKSIGYLVEHEVIPSDNLTMIGLASRICSWAKTQIPIQSPTINLGIGFC